MKKDNQDHFNVLRRINNKPELPKESWLNLGFSLGKLNYCLNALKDKGLIKIRNFKKIQIKLAIYTYLLLQVSKNRTYIKFYETKNSRI